MSDDCGNKFFDSLEEAKPPAPCGQPLNDLLYGVVEWINGNPVLDGMPYFDDKDAALKYTSERADMGEMGLPMKVEYTIIRLKKAI